MGGTRFYCANYICVEKYKGRFYGDAGTRYLSSRQVDAGRMKGGSGGDGLF